MTARHYPLWLGLLLAVALATESIPGLGVSLSAPFAGLLWLERWTHPGRPARSLWTWLSWAFFAGCAASLIALLWQGRAPGVEPASLLLLVRFGYWVVVFQLAAEALVEASWAGRLARAAALLAVALAGLRLADALAGGGWGPDAAVWLTQNEYGQRFSLLLPLLAATALARRASPLWLLGLVAVAATLAANASRSSWVAAGAGLVVAALVLLGAGRLCWRRTAALALAAAIGVSTLADGSATVTDRAASFRQLDRDKPFQTRLALVEKGRRLFAERPLLGHGLGRFSLARTELATESRPWLTHDELDERSAHNAYLKALAETGLAGALPLALLLGALSLRGAPAAVRLAGRGVPWAAGVFGSFAAISIHFLTLAGLNGTAPWLVYGWTAAMIERAGREEAT